MNNVTNITNFITNKCIINQQKLNPIIIYDIIEIWKFSIYLWN